MHLAAFLPLLGFASAAAVSNEVRCQAKTGAATMDAIDSFCKNTNIEVYSPYASVGTTAHGLSASTHAFISGSCPRGSTWVPTEWCLLQFYEVCAEGGPMGHGTKRFGVGGCQVFQLQG